MKRFSWLLLAVLVLISLVWSSCSTSSTPAPGSNPTPNKIRVATDAKWPPFEFINKETGQIEGFDIDLMKAIATHEHLEVEFINIAFDPMLEGVIQGQYDVAISSITINEERQKDMLFSDPYFGAGQIITLRKDDNTITGKDTLTGKIGVMKDSTGAVEVEKLKNVILVSYVEVDQVFQDLMNGVLNAVVCDNPVTLVYISKYRDKIKTAGGVFTNENYGIAVTKSRPELQAKINAGLKAINSQGLIEQLISKWLEGSQ
jgi:polar amino acid transport system substrate-binding protein